jgi:hypothetical protein
MELYLNQCRCENSDFFNNVNINEIEEKLSPSYKQLLDLVVELKLKNKNLESKISMLENNNNQSFSIIDKLNTQVPWIVLFKDWVNDLQPINLDLVMDLNNEKLFKSSELINLIVETIFSNEREFYFPILKHQKILFITTSQGWNEIDNEHLTIFTQKIENLLILKITNWKNENLLILNNYKNNEKYNLIIKNIIQISKKLPSVKNNLLKYIKPINKYNYKK